MVRAKFMCISKKQDINGFEIIFSPVVSGSPENAEFFKWTPYGELKMGTVNPSAAAEFEPGKEYFLDFTKVDNAKV